MNLKQFLKEYHMELLSITLVLIMLAMIFLLTGCAGVARTNGTTDTTLHETIYVNGSIPLPVPTATGTVITDVPIKLKISRNQSQIATSEAEKRSTFEAPEIAQALSGALRQAFPAIGAFIPPAKDHTAEIIAAITTALGIGGVALKMRSDGRRINDAKTNADAHQADANEAWDKLLELKDQTRATEPIPKV